VPSTRVLSRTHPESEETDHWKWSLQHSPKKSDERVRKEKLMQCQRRHQCQQRQQWFWEMDQDSYLEWVACGIWKQLKTPIDWLDPCRWCTMEVYESWHTPSVKTRGARQHHVLELIDLICSGPDVFQVFVNILCIHVAEKWIQPMPLIRRVR